MLEGIYKFLITPIAIPETIPLWMILLFLIWIVALANKEEDLEDIIKTPHPLKPPPAPPKKKNE